jgi:hypothetical protein
MCTQRYASGGNLTELVLFYSANVQYSICRSGLVCGPEPGALLAEGPQQGVTKRFRITWLTNSALVYEPKCREWGGVAGSQPMSTAVLRSRTKFWIEI